jgi:putative membrane protein
MSEAQTSFRNHPVVVVSGIVRALVAVAIITIWFYGVDDVHRLIAIDAALFSLIVSMSVIVWLKTTVTFEETEIYVLKDTIFRKETHIQYTRLASVNIERSLVDRLCGTATLSFNVNSSVNSNQAEATLRLKEDRAIEVRDELSKLIFSKDTTVEEDRRIESLVEVTNGEVIIHSFLSQPTPQLLFGILMFIYSVYSLFFNEGRGLLIALLMLVMSEVFPIGRVILKYANYRIYRDGDTITVESGLITTYRSSFKVAKVNSLRMRQPLIARALRCATLEAEVVGIAGKEGVPLLCPLKDAAAVRELIPKLIPEFDFDIEGEHQPKGALLPSSLLSIAAILISLVAGALIFIWSDYEPDETISMILFASSIVIPAATASVMGIRAYLLHREREMATDGNLLMLLVGAFDIRREYILFDKVQVSSSVAGPLERRRGLARLRVGTISSAGARTMTSGVFDVDEVETMVGIVADRIRDGRYDYRRHI